MKYQILNSRIKFWEISLKCVENRDFMRRSTPKYPGYDILRCFELRAIWKFMLDFWYFYEVWKQLREEEKNQDSHFASLCEFFLANLNLCITFITLLLFNYFYNFLGNEILALSEPSLIWSFDSNSV